MGLAPRHLFAGLTAIVLTAAPALAGSVSAAFPATLVAALQEAGYKAQLGTDDYGDPKIDSAAAGAEFSIYFYGCNDSGANCHDIQFSAGFDMADGMSLDSANSWNTEMLVAKVHLDDEMDPFLNFYVPAVDGMSGANFDRALDQWVGALGDFVSYIDW